MNLFKYYFAVFLTTAGGLASANTVINIGTNTGADIFSYPVAPGTIVTLQNPVLINFEAGDYQLADAWGQPSALYNAWNFQKDAAGSWGSHYVVAEPALNGSYSILLDVVGNLDPTCHNHFCAWDTEAEATAAFLATAPVNLHLNHATTVAFATADYFTPDNLGGMSISVTPVPVPASLWFFSACIIGLGYMKRLGRAKIGI